MTLLSSLKFTGFVLPSFVSKSETVANDPSVVVVVAMSSAETVSVDVALQEKGTNTASFLNESVEDEQEEKWYTRRPVPKRQKTKIKIKNRAKVRESEILF